MSRLLEVADLCSRTVSDSANRLRKTRKKKSSAVLLFKRSHIGNLHQIRKQGKGRSSKRKGNRRCPFLFAPAAGRGTAPAVRRRRIPAEVQRKTFRPLGEPACGSLCARSPGTEKEAARIGQCRKRCRFITIKIDLTAPRVVYNSRQITNHAREAVFTRGKYDEVPILQL